jgi:hypothetical protein
MWEDANEKVKEIPLLVQKYLSTINNKKFIASPELQKIYDESMEELNWRQEKMAMQTTIFRS